MRLESIMPGIASFRGYKRAWFRNDLTAGLSVAAVAVPVVLAYAQLAGLPPATGLYATMLPLLAYALFGSSRQLVTGPDAGTIVMVGAVLAPMVVGDPSRGVVLAGMLAVVVGLLFVLAGILKFGFLADFLSKPILVGYLNGVALHIIVGQLGKVFGFSVHGEGFFREIYHFLSGLGQTHFVTLAVALGVLGLLWLFRRIAPNLPGPLFAIAAATAAVPLFGLAARGVVLVGKVPAGLPPIGVTLPTTGELGALIVGSLGILLVSYTGGILPARAFAVKNGYDIDANRELAALGACNLAAGISQGFPVSGSASKTALADEMGSKTQLTGILAAGFVAAVLLFLTGPLAYMPKSALGAVLIYVALELFRLKSLRWFWRVDKPEFLFSVIATLGVVTVGVLNGILIAIALSILQLLRRASRPQDAILGRREGVDGHHDLRLHPDAKPIPGLIIYRFYAPILFFNADFFANRVRKTIREAKEKPQWFLLDAEAIIGADTTAVEKLEQIQRELADNNIVLCVARVNDMLRARLDRTGLSERIGRDNFFPTVRAGVEVFKRIGIRPNSGQQRNR